MQVYSNWLDLKGKYKKLVIGLGNFDGLHLGHQKLIHDLVAKARTIEGTPTIFTFFPHPLTVLRPAQAPAILLSYEMKRKMLAKMGIEVLILAPFTLDFAGMSPEEFIVSVLHKDLLVDTVFVGYNSTFGYLGRGTPELLKKYSRELGFGVEVIDPVTVNGQPVSSTCIRGLLINGEVAEAKELLGYYPFFVGHVVCGEKRGNELGFPTANLELTDDQLVPANGVYSVQVKIGQDMFLGVANIGVKPTFHDVADDKTIEVHLLDFNDNLYGQEIEVCFTRRLREEKRFYSPNELIEQIQKDISAARMECLQPDMFL